MGCTGVPSLRGMAWEPDEDGILRAGRWVAGEPDLEPIDLDPGDTPAPDPARDAAPPVPPTPPRHPGRTRAIAVTLVLAVLAGVAGFVATMVVLDRRDQPGASAIGDGQVLEGLIVQQSDLGLGDAVVELENGKDAVNVPTLDLCNGEYPSEASRIARRQVSVVGLDG